MKVLFFKLLCLLLFLNMANGQVITTVAGSGSIGYSGDGGPATNATMSWFGHVSIDKHHNLYIADANNNRIRKVDSASGIITTIAGDGTSGAATLDGVPATSTTVDYPTNVCLDASENLYILEPNQCRIRRVDKVTGIITTYAGTGICGFNGDGISATSAQIIPGPMAFDNVGNLYEADGTRRIRKISSSGIITTVAGNGISGISGNGGPASAALISPSLGLCTDKHGNIYFQDSSQSVRKITVGAGIITRVAGTGNSVYSPYSGDGIMATSCHIAPFGLSTDNFDNLYICDYANSIIERVDVNGRIYRVAGTAGVVGYSGDGGNPLAATMNPEGVTSDPCGNLYIADFGNWVVRQVLFNPSCTNVGVKDIQGQCDLSIYPNPTFDFLHLDNALSQTSFFITNPLGSIVQKGYLNKGSNSIDVSRLAIGFYLLHLIDSEGNRTVHKIIKQ